MRSTSFQLILIALLSCRGSSFVPNIPLSTNYGTKPTSLPSSYQQFRLRASETTTSTDENDTFKTNYQLLDQALKSDKESAKSLITKVGEFRQNKDQDGFDAFLNSLLDNIESTPSTPLPWWTKYRVTAKFSKRARKASLNRVIDLSSLKEEVEKNDDVLSNQSRRRRSLLLLLRSLAGDDSEDASAEDKKSASSRISIYKLEKIALKEAKKRITPQDILKRVPEGLETPKYKVVKSNYKNPPLFYEIREYDQFATCTVEMKSSKSSSSSSPGPAAAGSAFNSLAGYIFGNNQSSKKMAMTTPVFTSSTSDDSKQMSFVMPSDYWTELEKAPRPMKVVSEDNDSNDKGVMLLEQKSQMRAVLLFGGFASKKEVEVQKKELLSEVNQDSEWKLANDKSNSMEDILLAQYNDPFTPPWKRRNEVSILVTPKNE